MLPIALPLSCIMMLGLGALAFPHDSVRFGERLLGGMLLTLATVAVGVRVLGAAGVLTTAVVIGADLIVTANVLVAVRIRGLKMWPRRWPVSLSTLPVLGVAAFALGVVTLAAYFLPVWQWDALGYHLPYVNFALQRGTFADIPVDVAYVSTYPHVVEHVFIAWRALIPDDRLVDLAHLPFGLLGATAVGVIAYRQGARASAVAAGAVWLTLPAVFLQLPTNYVDVASAALLLTAIAFVLSSVDSTRVMLSAIALGMFLGSKPSAPLAAVLVFSALAVAAWRSGLRPIAIAAVVVLLLGGESYLTNFVRQGNPVWPVRIDLGPIHLPGRFPMSDLLASGAAAPRTQGSLAMRVFDSWTTIWPAVPAFHLRRGGRRVLMRVALPFALVSVIRQRSIVVVLVFVATLATPDPAVARYVLAFAGLVLAFAVPTIDHPRVGKFVHASALVLVALGAAHNVYVAYPGLTGEGPPLRAYVDMSDYERRRAVGADGVPTPFLDAVARVGPGEIAVFDETAYLPYLAWPPDPSRDAVRIPDDATAEEADRLVHADDVRLLIVGDDTVAGSVVRRDPARFIRIFECKSSTCAVYLRR